MGDESNPMKPASPEQAVFAEALLRPTPEARVAYLDGTCGLDTPLRRRVEALLRAAQNAGDFLEEPPTGLSNAGGTTMVVNVPSEQPGDKIGRYKLLQQIGEGGCGVVYMAEQEEPVRRRVALKVIKLGMDTKEVIARFEAERQALALMDHPNIAKVLDGGATQTGRPYFVMELVRGIKITDYCDQNNLPTEERLKLFTQVCQAIQHAHQKGIIHRDIKPSNILVTISEPGSPGCPKVIDFGIAKATTGQRLTDKTVFTAFEQFIGTPAYMSPEQAMMTSLDIDTRTDIYALGVLLYELLTGRTPFDAKELMAGGLDAMRRIILEQEPARPSTRLSTLLAADLTAVASHRHAEPARLGTLLRGDLDWIVMKALEKDRTRRYETANGLAADVQRHLDNEPVVARPPSTGYRFQKMVRRNKLAFAAATAVMATLMIGLGVSLWLFFRETKAHDRAVAAESLQTRLREDADRARAGEAVERKKAEENELAARQNLYAADMNLAQQAIKVGNLGYARALLDGHRPAPGRTDVRGFEWRYLWEAARGDNLATLRGHSRVVVSIALSPDGKTILSGSQDGTVRLWDLASHKLISTLNFQDGLYSVAFAPDGKVFAAGLFGKGVTLWDATNLRLLATFDGDIAAVVFAPKGNLLAYGSSGDFYPGAGKDVTVWDYVANREVARIPRGGARVAFYPDASVLALGGQNEGVTLWNLASQQSVGHLPKAATVQSMAFSPDGKNLVVSYWAGDLLVWDLAGQRVLTNLAGHTGMVWDMAFSPDGKILATASSDQTVRLWDVGSWQTKGILRGHGDEVWAVKFTPDGQTLVTGSKDETIMLWPVHPERPATLIPGVGSAPLISQDTSMLVAMDSRGRVVLWDSATAQPKRLSERPAEPLALYDGGKGLITVERAGTLTFWDTRSHSVRSQTTLRESGEINGAALSHDTKTLATWSPRQLRFWSVDDGQALAAFEANFDNFAFSPDEKHFVTVDNGSSKAVVWDRISGRQLGDLNGHKMFIASLVIAPDGNTLVTGGQDGLIIVWDIRERRARVKIIGHEGAVAKLAVSPDGKTLASSSTSTVKLWHLATFREIVSFTPKSQPPYYLAFSPDSRMFVMGGGKGPLHVLRAPSFEEIAAKEAKEKVESKQP